MAVAARAESAQYRLARHYLGKLSHANNTLNRGTENRMHSLHLVDRDWAQIKQWQAWAGGWSEREPERAHLCVSYSLRASEILTLRLTPDERLKWLQQGWEAAKATHDQAAERTMRYRLAHAYMTVGNTEEADRLCNQLIEDATGNGDQISQGRAHYVLGVMGLVQGRFDAAGEHLHKSHALFENFQSEAEYGRILQSLGRLMSYHGDLRAAHDYYLRYLRFVTGTDREGEYGVALLTVAQSLINLGEYDTAFDYAQRAVQVCRRIGFVRMLPPTLLVQANAEVRLKQYESARRNYIEGLALARENNDQSTIVHALHGLGHVEIGENQDLDKALALWKEGLEIARVRKLPLYTYELLHDSAAALLERHHVEAAQAFFAEFAEVALGFDTEYYSAKMIGLAALYLSRTEQLEQAARWVGLLMDYREHVEGKEFDELCAELEAALGREQYESLVSEGKALDFTAARDESAALLRG
jgi:tetratricopeptide (TPR) repeat protein